MAEKSTKDTVQKDPMQETVEVILPFVPGEPDQVFVGLNGKGYSIQRGQSVKLPKPVYDIYLESQRMKQEKQEKIRAMIAEAQKPKTPSF